MFGICLGYVLDMFGICIGHVLDMFWTCVGHVLDMCWICLGHVLDMFRTEDVILSCNILWHVFLKILIVIWWQKTNMGRNLVVLDEIIIYFSYSVANILISGPGYSNMRVAVDIAICSLYVTLLNYPI